MAIAEGQYVVDQQIKNSIWSNTYYIQNMYLSIHILHFSHGIL